MKFVDALHMSYQIAHGSEIIRTMNFLLTVNTNSISQLGIRAKAVFAVDR